MTFDWGSALGLARSRPGSVVPIRTTNAKKVLVLVHGFTGVILGSWDGFYQLLSEDTSLASWDIIGLSYPSTNSIDTWSFMRGDPSLSTLSLSFRTSMSLPPFDRYQSIAIAAHSMGGLFVQRAIVDTPALAQRVSHLALYGVPSAGVGLAALIAAFKKQARDMAKGSAFLTNLRSDWDAQFQNDMPFRFVTVAGDVDEFVPVSSSLEPFAEAHQAVVPGDHSTIIRPTPETRQGYDLMRRLLGGEVIASTPNANALLKLENGEYELAVQNLLPHASSIDEAALAALALALDGLGRGDEALSLLEEHFRAEKISSTEAAGILAGRVKRRWLVERRSTDLDRAFELYERGYVSASAIDDHQQGYYHAINLSFLHLVSAPLNSVLPATVKTWAEKALWHCGKAPFSNWRVATEAEARLIIGQEIEAYALYGEAVSVTKSSRQLSSMYSQASRIAERQFGTRGLEKIKAIFDRFRD